MELIRTKIELYRMRTFSDKISDTFAFIRETWRPLLKYFVGLMLPLSIVLAFFYDNFFAGYMSLMANIGGGNGAAGYDPATLVRLGGMTLWLLLLSYAAGMVLVALVFSMIRLYKTREQQLQQLEWPALRPELTYCLKRSACLMAVTLVVGVLVFLLAMLIISAAGSIHPALSVVGLLVFYAAVIAVILPLSLLLPAYMLEDSLGVVQALKKAFRLGFATWGGIFAVMFVMGLLVSALQTITSLPWYVMALAKTLFTLEGDATGFMGTAGYSFLQYLLSVWMVLGYLMSSVLMMVALTVQYGHAADKIDGVGVSQKIDNFDELDAF